VNSWNRTTTSAAENILKSEVQRNIKGLAWLGNFSVK